MFAQISREMTSQAADDSDTPAPPRAFREMVSDLQEEKEKKRDALSEKRGALRDCAERLEQESDRLTTIMQVHVHVVSPLCVNGWCVLLNQHGDM